MPHPESSDANSRDVRPSGDPRTSTPRWVKVFWIIGVAVAVLVVALLLTGGHGPGRHMHSSSAGLIGSSPIDDHAASSEGR